MMLIARSWTPPKKTIASIKGIDAFIGLPKNKTVIRYQRKKMKEKNTRINAMKILLNIAVTQSWIVNNIEKRV